MWGCECGGVNVGVYSYKCVVVCEFVGGQGVVCIRVYKVDECW